MKIINRWTLCLWAALLLLGCAGTPDTVAERREAPPPPAEAKAATPAPTPTPAPAPEPKVMREEPIPRVRVRARPPEPPPDPATIVESDAVLYPDLPPPAEPPPPPVDPRTPGELLFLARMALDFGDSATAAPLLETVVARSGPGDPRRRDAVALLAPLYAAQARFAEVVMMVADLERPPPPDTRRLFAEALEAEQNHLEAVMVYDSLFPETDPIEHDELAMRIRYLVSRMRPEELDLLAIEKSDRLGAYALLELARRALATGARDRAESLLEAVIGLGPRAAEGPADPVALAARELLRRTRASRTEQPGTVGVLLPLTGPLALFGEKVLNGIMVGAGLFVPDPVGAQSEAPPGDAGLAAASPRFVLHDTKGDPVEAARGVEELAARGAVGIIGPLKGDVARAAAGTARELGVALLTPTPATEIAGSGVFRLHLRPEDEIDRLVDHLITVNSVLTFAVLAPDTEPGRQYAELFTRAVEAKGAMITGVEFFPPEDNVSLKLPLAKLTYVHRLSEWERRELFEIEWGEKERRAETLERALAEGLPAPAPEPPAAWDPAPLEAYLASLAVEPSEEQPAPEQGAAPPGASEELPPEEEPAPLTEEELAAEAEREAAKQKAWESFEPKPRVEFGAVFLPVDSKTAALLAPQFPYYDVNDVILAGIRSWNYPLLPKIGKQYVEGAIFPAEWHPATAEGEGFSAAYREAYGKDPGVFEAYGHDAAALMTRALGQGFAAGRAEVARNLSLVWAAPGVTGPLTTHPNGEIASEPKLLTVHHRQIVPVTTFTPEGQTP